MVGGNANMWGDGMLEEGQIQPYLGDPFRTLSIFAIFVFQRYNGELFSVSQELYRRRSDAVDGRKEECRWENGADEWFLSGYPSVFHSVL